MVERFGIITNCTARKRAVEPVARLRAAELKGGAAKVGARWLQTTATAQASTTAGELYLGRAMSESKTVAAQLNGSLHIISAGLGLIARDDLVPNYDMTVASGAGSLTPALAESGSSTADWWQELNALERFYIFTSSSGAKHVPERLLRCVLGYDERLEGHSDYAGTRSDFPQRAMRHFVEQLHGHRLTRKCAMDAVQESLRVLKKPSLPQRERKSDPEILELIRTQWHNYAGSSSRLHRYLRDTALVACEQSRFGGLWRQVKAEIQ